jgi:hypothetical protein
VNHPVYKYVCLNKLLLILLFNVILSDVFIHWFHTENQKHTVYTPNVDFAIIVQLTHVFTQIIRTAANCCSNIILIEGQFHYTVLPPVISFIILEPIQTGGA